MFQRKINVKDVVRNGQRDIAKSVRGLDKELQELKREEVKLLHGLKVEAKKGNRETAAQMAKSVVRLREQQKKLQANKGQISGVGTSLRVQQATAASAGAMATAGSAVQAMNKSADPQKMMRDAEAFSRENARMNMASDFIDDAFDDLASDNEEEADETVNQVLDEIGIDLKAQLKAAPRGRAAAATAPAAEEAELNKLLARLNS